MFGSPPELQLPNIGMRITASELGGRLAIDQGRSPRFRQLSVYPSGIGAEIRLCQTSRMALRRNRRSLASARSATRRLLLSRSPASIRRRAVGAKSNRHDLGTKDAAGMNLSCPSAPLDAVEHGKGIFYKPLKRNPMAPAGVPRRTTRQLGRRMGEHATEQLQGLSIQETYVPNQRTHLPLY